MGTKREWTVVDIEATSDLARLASEVDGDQQPRLLRRDGEAVAVLISVAEARNLGFRGPHTADDFAMFRSAAGSWQEVDTDRLLEDIYADRGHSVESTLKP